MTAPEPVKPQPCQPAAGQIRWRRAISIVIVACALATPLAPLAPLAPVLGPPPASAAVGSGSPTSPRATPGSSSNANALEAAAAKAGDVGRKVATSLLALAFAIAAIVLTFKRDFKEAVGVFAVGIVAVLLVTPAGLNLIRDTVALLFGSQ